MSSCICKPWRGYHKPECPCQAAYEELKAERAADDSLSDSEARAQAATLLAEGWQQQSRKYFRVVRVPSGSSAIAELERLDPARAAAVRQRAAIALETDARQCLWHYGETRELPPKVFDAFRELLKR